MFTHDQETTIDRMADEHDCLAVLIAKAMRPVENVLVAIRGFVGIDRFVRLVSGLFATLDVDVTLYHVAGEDETDADVETLLDGVATRLSDAGVSSDAIDIQISRGSTPQAEIVETADNYDAIVMGGIRSVRDDLPLRDDCGSGRQAVPWPGVRDPARRTWTIPVEVRQYVRRPTEMLTIT